MDTDKEQADYYFSLLKSLSKETKFHQFSFLKGRPNCPFRYCNNNFLYTLMFQFI